jgi:hypothetical protein
MMVASSLARNTAACAMSSGSPDRWTMETFPSSRPILTPLLGMFVGATLLALGYQIFMNWVATNPEEAPARPKRDSPEMP